MDRRFTRHERGAQHIQVRRLRAPEFGLLHLTLQQHFVRARLDCRAEHRGDRLAVRRLHPPNDAVRALDSCRKYFDPNTAVSLGIDGQAIQILLRQYLENTGR